MRPTLSELLKEAEKIARVKKGLKFQKFVNAFSNLAVIISATLFIINGFLAFYYGDSVSNWYPIILVISILAGIYLTNCNFERPVSKEETNNALRDLLKSRHSELKVAEELSKKRLESLRIDVEEEEASYKIKIYDLHEFQLLAIGIEKDYLK